ncbi:coiled-coil domain-containing protein 137 [Daktulosphaira vitifoliae]|uniref:coiled-coil domain-containing protein 137 n=1 Tax=Daktulosphaira vitifoliae TaxID=58002 RepID=UPI0021A9E0FC|nr:coiled-coil domain-containing protein 137 [Daktulosphaira vitifoliae]
MARKFKSKKQKRVKDVFEQIAKRNEELKGKINKPPKDPKYQDVPRSLKEFIQLKQLAKTNAKVLLKQKSLHDINIGGSRLPKRSPKCAFNIEDQSLEIINSVSKNDEENRPATVLSTKEKLLEFKRKRQLKTKLKRQKKQQKKKQKLEEEFQDKVEYDKEYLKDCFKFGETVHCPPSLTVKPRKAAINDFENRPGRKDDLFLKSMLTDPGNINKMKKISNVILKKPNEKTIKRKAFTGKRKQLTLSDRRVIEKERDFAVQTYRELKKNVTNKNI